jgi:putative sigma-54 modulation protein
MQLDVTGKNIEVTDSLRDYIREKLDRITRHFDNVIDVHVVLSVEKHRHFAEVNVSASGAKLHADAEDKDMYAAVDEMADKIDRQVRKHKEKRQDRDQDRLRKAKEQPPEEPE